MRNLTAEYLHEVFEYKEGVLYWKINPRFNVKVGDASNSLCKRGYRQSRLGGKLYYSHRLIFLMHNGYLPKFIDHIDGNPLNNRIENLRGATNSENNWNSKIPHNNTSGLKNVCWDKNKNKWTVRLKKFGKLINIGRFADLELAELVAMEARNKYHGKYASNGI